MDIPAKVKAALGGYAGGRVLLVVPDSTRTAPLGPVFREIHRQIRTSGGSLRVIIALGTHRPMSEAAIRERLEISEDEARTTFRDVNCFNHAWRDPEALMHLGTISSAEVRELSRGRFELEVPVTIHRSALESDLVLILGPVFPHEVVGFSGGNKYLFPGIGGAELIDFFHWLGATITSPRVMGHKHTAVRAVIDRAATMLPTPRRALCMVVHRKQLVDLHAGTPEEAWSAAADVSASLHIETWDKPVPRIIAKAPPMYNDLWVAGKCMYKLEPVVADGGELVIFSPNLTEVSVTHGEAIRRIGYHVRDYFLADWERFRHEPWGVLAHSTHVRGVGKMVDGVEVPRIQVTLATGISPEVCAEIGLGYLDPATIDFDNVDAVVIPDAGETLYRLVNPPDWADPVRDQTGG